MLVKLTIGANFTIILHAAFCAKVYCAGALCLQFLCIFFDKRKLGAKAACKMLAKLKKNVNFTIILQAAFLYKSIFRSFSVLTACVCTFLGKSKLA